MKIKLGKLKHSHKKVLFYKYIKKELDEGAVIYKSYPAPVSEILIAQLPDGEWNVDADSLFPEKSFKKRTDALEYAETNMKKAIEEEREESKERLYDYITEPIKKHPKESTLEYIKRRERIYGLNFYQWYRDKNDAEEDANELVKKNYKVLLVKSAEFGWDIFSDYPEKIEFVL